MKGEVPLCRQLSVKYFSILFKFSHRLDGLVVKFVGALKHFLKPFLVGSVDDMIYGDYVVNRAHFVFLYSDHKRRQV